MPRAEPVSSVFATPDPAVDLSFEIRTAQNVPLALEPASVGQRIMATVIDIVIGIAWMLMTLWMLSKMGADSFALLLLVVWLPPFLYHLVMEVLFEGRTVGKMVMSTRVARLDGAQPTLAQYLLRWLLRLVDVTVTSGVVAVVSVALTKRSQRLGDLAAGTTVVRQRRRLEWINVLYPMVPDDYEPVFPEAENLSDAEIRTVRAVIARLQISKGDRRAQALAERAQRAVERRLDLEPTRLAPEAFLRTIVRDHVARLDRFGQHA